MALSASEYERLHRLDQANAPSLPELRHFTTTDDATLNPWQASGEV